MAKNIFDDEDAFSDRAVTYKNGQWQESESYTPAPETEVRANRIAQQAKQEEEIQVEQYAEEDETQPEESEEEEDYESVLSDARLRLEQGKLYEMILNHDLFAGVEADPRAAKAVQKQIRNFAKESMEVMLGMRSTVPAHVNGPMVMHASNASQFNYLEIEYLKELAKAASKGATEEVEKEEAKKQPQEPPKKKTLNSIGPNKQSRPQQIQSKPLQKKVEPLKRAVKPRLDLPPEMEPDYVPLDKPIEKMTSAELEARNREAAERQSNRKAALPPDRAPIPSYETREMLAASQVARATKSLNANLTAVIQAAVKGK